MTPVRPVLLLLPAVMLAMPAPGAGKPPKPSALAVTVTFRCYSNLDAGAPDACQDLLAAPEADRVRDDDLGSYAGSISSSGILAATFSPSSPGAARHATLMLGTSLSDPLCVQAGIDNCNPDGSPAGQPQVVSTFDVKLRPQTGSSAPFVDLSGGLPAMPCHVNHPAVVQYTFWLDGGDGHWGVNFNPNTYPLGTPATIRRTSTQQWVVTAGATERAELVSFSHSGISRRNGPSREGVFVVPFKMTVDATQPAPPGTGC